MSTANKFISTVSANSANMDAYLDTAAELSKIDRKNHHQISESGVPLMYDMMVTVSCPSQPPSGFISGTNQTILSGTIKVAPKNWQTRNSVRMAHFDRLALRKEAGVSKGSIGKYAKTMRMNLNGQMHDLPYQPKTAVGAPEARFQRLYANRDPDSLPAYTNVSNFTGGVWDYTQLAQVSTTDANASSEFYLNLCGQHSGSPSAGYTYIGVIEGYNQRRQTVRDSSTVNAGGDTQFIENDSPFFRIPQQDVSEDAYVEVTLDEQDNPPYDRTTGGTSDSVQVQPIEFFNLTMQVTQQTFRVQAPLGLLQFDFRNLWGTGYVEEPDTSESLWTEVQNITVEVECLGTYEM